MAELLMQDFLKIILKENEYKHLENLDLSIFILMKNHWVNIIKNN